jgi:hypothetical protein
MRVFPKSYEFNRNEPKHYPFQNLPGGGWDHERFNPAFFRQFEMRVRQLVDMGIEADLILFHPYDRWGFSDMGEENNHRRDERLETASSPAKALSTIDGVSIQQFTRTPMGQ